MNKEYLGTISRIENECDEINQVVDRILRAWKTALENSDDLYFDSVALNLHSFYSAIERIFELIAVHIDGSSPSGQAWHRDLLHVMATEIKMVRPAVISKESLRTLDEYRGFRHVVRNVYATVLVPERMERLVVNISKVFQQLTKELYVFCDELRDIAMK